MAFPVSEEQKAIFRRRLAATARELQPPTGSFAESARARQAAANDRANGIMPVRGPDQPAFSYQDHVGNNNRQLYGNSQANRGGNENAQGYVPHPSPRIPAAPVPSNGYDEPGVTLPNAMPVSEKPVLPGNINQLPPGGLAMPVRQQPAMASRLPPLTPQDVAAISRSQAEGRGADSLREKIAGIMAAPAIQGPVMDSPQIQSMRAQKDANVRTYGSMGRSPEMQDRMESGYNKAMGIGQPTQAGEQPQSIFPRQAPPNNRMQGSVPVGPSRDMSGANGVQMGSFRPGGSQVPYIPSQGTDGSIQNARFVVGRRNAPLTEGNRGTFVGRADSGALSLTGDELTPAQRKYYANQSAKIAQSQAARAQDYKDTRAMRALGRNPSLKNRPAVADALVRRAESAQGKATSLANAKVSEARDMAFRDESFAREKEQIKNRFAKQRGQWMSDGMTDQQVDQAEQAEYQDSYDRHYGPKANVRSGTTASGAGVGAPVSTDGNMSDGTAGAIGAATVGGVAAGLLGASYATGRMSGSPGMQGPPKPTGFFGPYNQEVRPGPNRSLIPSTPSPTGWTGGPQGGPPQPYQSGMPQSPVSGNLTQQPNARGLPAPTTGNIGNQAPGGPVSSPTVPRVLPGNIAELPPAAAARPLGLPSQPSVRLGSPTSQFLYGTQSPSGPVATPAVPRVLPSSAPVIPQARPLGLPEYKLGTANNPHVTPAPKGFLYGNQAPGGPGFSAGSAIRSIAPSLVVPGVIHADDSIRRSYFPEQYQQEQQRNERDTQQYEQNRTVPSDSPHYWRYGAGLPDSSYSQLVSMPLQPSMYDQMEPAFGFGNDPSRVMPQVPVSPFPGVRRDMLGSTQFPKLTAQQQQELLRRALQQQSQQPSY